MKKEARVAIFTNANSLYALCIFRGNFLEKIFLEYNKDGLIQNIYSSSVVKEIMYSNINIGKRYNEKILEEVCKTIVNKISEKLNTDKTNF